MSSLRARLLTRRWREGVRDLVLRATARDDLAGYRADLARRYLRGEGIEIGALHRPVRLPRAAHVRYVDTETGRKGYPTAVGEALSPKIGILFNSIALCQTGPGGKRTIQTATTAMIDLKNPKPFEMEPKYPLETGLADFFKVLLKEPTHAERHIPEKEESRPRVATGRRS